MHHKRRRPRNSRAGCKMCKYWKVNGYRTERKAGEKASDHKRRMAADIDLEESWEYRLHPNYSLEALDKEFQSFLRGEK